MSIITYVALDSHVLKVAQGQESGSGGIVSAILARDIHGLTDQETSHILAESIASLPHPTQAVEFCLPRQFAILRNMELPADKEAEIRELASFQAVKQTPYSLDEIVWDLEILQTQAGTSRVMLVIVQRDVVDRLLRIADHAKTQVRAIRLASQCFEALLPDERSLEQTLGLISVDPYRSHLLVLSPGKGKYSRSMPVGWQDIGMAGKLANELDLSFAAYRKENPGAQVGTLYFESDREDLPALANYAFARIDVLAKIQRDPSMRMDIPADMRISFADILGGFLSPSALKLNLLPQDIRRDIQSAHRRRYLLQTAALSAVLLALCLGHILEKIVDKKLHLRQLQNRLQGIENAVGTLEEQNKKIKMVRALAQTQGEATNAIAELYRLAPDTISLSALSYERGHSLVIKGTARDLSDVFSLIPVLEKSPVFDNVTSQYASKRRLYDREYADFQLQCLIGQARAQ